jgi:hypothetical protein
VSVVLLPAAARSAIVQTPASTPPDQADALSAAARKGDAAAVKKLLDDGVDVNTPPALAPDSTAM